MLFFSAFIQLNKKEVQKLVTLVFNCHHFYTSNKNSHKKVYRVVWTYNSMTLFNAKILLGFVIAIIVWIGKAQCNENISISDSRYLRFSVYWAVAIESFPGFLPNYWAVTLDSLNWRSNIFVWHFISILVSSRYVFHFVQFIARPRDIYWPGVSRKLYFLRRQRYWHSRNFVLLFS